MNKDEALPLLDHALARFRPESHVDLAGRVDGESIRYEQDGPSGARYQLEIQFFRDARSGGDVRVVASIDDGGWRAFVPVTRAFIKSADGSFVGD